ncbi:hypothetical protein D9619_009520 [Psilocybe cf. subviscida]|uniref:Uncharacterized protein n=1 Tax=Psilocybe cf. subviscida TaxID=2480587 RepID=A0A8H5BL71_9AGAR|nr:hypothetical protein D9619_009520 [Psilocybe cf. subviscida]
MDAQIPSTSPTLHDAIDSTGPLSEIRTEHRLLTLEARCLMRHVHKHLPEYPLTDIAFAFESNMHAVQRVIENNYYGRADTVGEISKCPLNRERLAAVNEFIDTYKPESDDESYDFETATPSKLLSKTRNGSSSQSSKPQSRRAPVAAGVKLSEPLSATATTSSSKKRKRASLSQDQLDTPGLASPKRVKLLTSGAFKATDAVHAHAAPSSRPRSRKASAKAVRNFFKKLYGGRRPSYVDGLIDAGLGIDEMLAFRNKDQTQIMQLLLSIKDLPSDLKDNENRFKFFSTLIVQSKENTKAWNQLLKPEEE